MATDAVKIPGATRMLASSWVDVVNGWFERLPGPVWAGYLVASGIAISISSAAPIWTGVADGGAALLGLVYYAALPFGILGLIERLDRTASEALAAIRPLLRLDDDELAAAHGRLTAIPARPTWLLTIISAVATAVGYALDPVSSGVVGLSTVSLVIRGVWETIVSALFLILIYHTIRQLRLIGRIHERLGSIDLFAQAPLYALSRLTSQTAVGLILLLIPSLFLLPPNPDISYVLITGIWYGGSVVMALAAFVVPLRGVHDRLVGEKRRLQAETGRRLTTTLASLHAAADAGDAATVDARGKTLAALVAARDVVNRAPTWPWSSGALTGFVSAIVLPIALFLIQRYLIQLA